MGQLVAAFVAALLVSVVTAPVGVSGAVFLLPVQLDLLRVPNPAVTPTNLMYNIVAGPGALLRYRRAGRLGGPLVRQLLVGMLPGVVVGAVIRVYLVPGPKAFKLVAAVVLAGLGGWLILRTLSRSTRRPGPLRPARVTALAVAVGVVGGVYGIGGGSIVGPALVASGMAVERVAPAALAATFVTSAVGAVTFVVLSTFASGAVAPVWSVGVALGLGGLIGGYLGATLQPRLPERALRLLLGGLAVALSVVYVVQGVA